MKAVQNFTTHSDASGKTVFAAMNNSTNGLLHPQEVLLFQVLKGTALTLLVLWTIGANCLVFVVLYKNPKLQTVPNLLVGNLAFSDLCLGTIVLPLSTVNTIIGKWVFRETLCEAWLSSDILCCTASIWNLSIVGLDRYWAITSPVAYLNKRNKRTAMAMIGCVWVLAALISLAPLFGWKHSANQPNYVEIHGLPQCTFMDLPGYTIYSATGSFFVPTLVMFFVYFQIYLAFAKHRARQIFRQKVIRKHIESTILHEISHVLPTSDEFAKEEEEDDDDSASDNSNDRGRNNGPIIEEDEEVNLGDPTEEGGLGSRSGSFDSMHHRPPKRSIEKLEKADREFQQAVVTHNKKLPKKSVMISYEQVKRAKNRKEKRAMLRKSLQKKPKAISAAKERRGVKVLGIILGCFTLCWTPFFVMYVLTAFCSDCKPNPHVEQFITWLGYSNSAMNPIIYTVFNRDYQTALKRLFSTSSLARTRV